jgi:hypothetical protein
LGIVSLRTKEYRQGHAASRKVAIEDTPRVTTRASGGQATTTVGTGDRCDVSYRSRLGDTDAFEKPCTYLLEGNQQGITNTRQGRFADGDANLRKLGPFSQPLKKTSVTVISLSPTFLFIYLFIFLNQNRSNHLGPEVTLSPGPKAQLPLWSPPASAVTYI